MRYGRLRVAGKIVVFFYGYVFEFASVPNGPSVAGHYALRRVLNSPDIDVLCSPISYFDRGLGQGHPSMTAAESVALAGKMWLNEDDTRTYLGTGDFPGAIDAVSTLEDTNRELLRNVGQEAIRNFGTWWMDLGAHRLVQRPADVERDGPNESDRRAVAGTPIGIPARDRGRDRRACHAVACGGQRRGYQARHLRCSRAS